MKKADEAKLCLRPCQPKFDLTGMKSGKLLVLSCEGRQGTRYYWRCQCSCGVETLILQQHLRNGNSLSCGCRIAPLRTTHGMRDTPIYRRWSNIISRCVPGHYSAKNYGDKGIRVCERWKKFENFLEDMGIPMPGMSIDRIDPAGDYEPGNCRWTDWFQQARNRRWNRRVIFHGKTMLLAEAADLLGVSLRLLQSPYTRAYRKHEPLIYKGHEMTLHPSCYEKPKRLAAFTTPKP